MSPVYFLPHSIPIFCIERVYLHCWCKIRFEKKKQHHLFLWSYRYEYNLKQLLGAVYFCGNEKKMHSNFNFISQSQIHYSWLNFISVMETIRFNWHCVYFEIYGVMSEFVLKLKKCYSLFTQRAYSFNFRFSFLKWIIQIVLLIASSNIIWWCSIALISFDFIRHYDLFKCFQYNTHKYVVCVCVFAIEIKTTVFLVKMDLKSIFAWQIAQNRLKCVHICEHDAFTFST